MRRLLALAALLGLAAAAHSQVLRECLSISKVSAYGRSPVFRDRLLEQIVAGTHEPPTEGQQMAGLSGQQVWRKAVAGEDGRFSGPDFEGGYAAFEIVSERPRTALLTAWGDSMGYVNDEPIAGDVYGYGYLRIPVLLRAGRNELLFAVERGSLKVELSEPPAQPFLNVDDPTLPDVVSGGPVLGAVVVVNPTKSWAKGLSIAAMTERGAWETKRVPTIPPLSMRKVAFSCRTPAPNPGLQTVDVKLKLLKGDSEVGSASVQLRVRKPEQARKLTFVGKLDGSVQYYALVPPAPGGPEGGGLILSLHGASVEAIGQAECYTPKPGISIVCPTNRRPYGYSWEDFGRKDALEVLDMTLPSVKGMGPVGLTGHSMGGHGTWQLGAMFPDRFGALGPSAGWISWYTYGGAQRAENPTAIEVILERAATASDTPQFINNYSNLDIYVLHGDQDDNVPVTEARRMRELIAPWHPSFKYHEQPGAGHWWGNQSVDWPPLIETLSASKSPKAPRDVIDFTTANPGLSDRYQWASIQQQERIMALSRIRLTRTASGITGTTQNVRLLSLDLPANAVKGFTIRLDGGESIGVRPSQARVFLRRQGTRWLVAGPPRPGEKNPLRAGPLKEAFDQRFAFVYPTAGSPAENAESLAVAKFWAQSFYYRANGDVEMLSDREAMSLSADRTAVLFGNASINRAWGRLLRASPVKVDRNTLTIGGRRFNSSDLAAVFIRPGRGARSYVVAIGGTGAAGIRLAARLPVFGSGVAFPDVLAISPRMLSEGVAGVVATGFFGNDWTVESGEFAYGDSG